MIIFLYILNIKLFLNRPRGVCRNLQKNQQLNYVTVLVLLASSLISKIQYALKLTLILSNNFNLCRRQQKSFILTTINPLRELLYP
jgi:hypothetical protein